MTMKLPDMVRGFIDDFGSLGYLLIGDVDIDYSEDLDGNVDTITYTVWMSDKHGGIHAGEFRYTSDGEYQNCKSMYLPASKLEQHNKLMAKYWGKTA